MTPIIAPTIEPKIASRITSSGEERDVIRGAIRGVIRVVIRGVIIGSIHGVFLVDSCIRYTESVYIQDAYCRGGCPNAAAAGTFGVGTAYDSRRRIRIRDVHETETFLIEHPHTTWT